MPFDLAYKQVLCRLNLESEMNVPVHVQYQSDSISEQLVIKHSNLTLKEISAGMVSVESP